MLRQGSETWLAERRGPDGYIGASEIAALYGRDPYKGEFDVWLDKTGRSEGQPSSWPMTWGSRVQRLALEVYSEIAGKKVRNVTRTTTNRRWPHVRATPDGRVVGERRGVEAKWTGRNITVPPEHWILQCQGQMGVCDLDVVDIIRLSGRDEPLIMTVQRDEALIDEMLDGAEAWYCRYVLGDEPPPMDGSRGASRYLDSLPAEDIPMVASVEQDFLVGQLAGLRQKEEQAKAEADDVVNRIKESMVGSYRLEGRGYHVTWKPTKARTTVDWQAIAAEYRLRITAWESALNAEWDPEADLGGIERKHTTTGEGSRPFRLSLDKEEDAA
jgi:putative phage-type endonuclease